MRCLFFGLNEKSESLTAAYLLGINDIAVPALQRMIIALWDQREFFVCFHELAGNCMRNVSV